MYPAIHSNFGRPWAISWIFIWPFFSVTTPALLGLTDWPVSMSDSEKKPWGRSWSDFGGEVFNSLNCNKFYPGIEILSRRLLPNVSHYCPFCNSWMAQLGVVFRTSSNILVYSLFMLRGPIPKRARSSQKVSTVSRVNLLPRLTEWPL